MVPRRQKPNPEPEVENDDDASEEASIDGKFRNVQLRLNLGRSTAGVIWILAIAVLLGAFLWGIAQVLLAWGTIQKTDIGLIMLSVEAIGICATSLALSRW